MKKQAIYLTLMCILGMFIIAACNNDDNDNPTPTDDYGVGMTDDDGMDPDDDGSSEVVTTYVLGLGVTTATETTNFVIETEDLMSGVISLEGQGTVQDGYRDYAFGGDTFYATGGLGVTDVNAITANPDGTLNIQSGLTFEFQVDGFRDVDGNGNTMLGISSPLSPSTSENMQFYTVDIASNTKSDVVNIPFSDVYDTTQDWIFHTGMQVDGDKLYQTFYPVSATTFDTQNTDTLYVAVYDYPEFEFDTVIKDTRTGPAGAFNTRSGIFRAENGDMYTISTTSFANGYSQSTKPAGILRIPAGTSSFDDTYFFNTEVAQSPGGKIAHAVYIGDNKLFAAITVANHTIDNRWTDANLRLAIVDLVAETITLVDGAPEFSGNGGRSFPAFQEGDNVFTAITDQDGVLNIYSTDINTATAVKGAEIQATFVGGIARLQ